MEQHLGAAIPDHAAHDAALRDSIRALTVTAAPETCRSTDDESIGVLPPIGALCVAAPCQILIVEDNIVNQNVAQRQLHHLGYRADTAANGREAIAALQNHTYDVLLKDLRMPEMDGLEATRIIREQLAQTRQPVIIAMTVAAL